MGDWRVDKDYGYVRERICSCSSKNGSCAHINLPEELKSLGKKEGKDKSSYILPALVGLALLAGLGGLTYCSYNDHQKQHDLNIVYLNSLDSKVQYSR